MSSQQCFVMKGNQIVSQNVTLSDVHGYYNISNVGEAKPSLPKEKVMSYEEKSVGSTPFFKCEACPFMALAEDDIKFHLFTEHPDLSKTNGLADNIQIPCPGCASSFDAEETLRTHLRNHHKMGIKDVKKMVKSLVQIALKNAKLKKESKVEDPPPQVQVRQELVNREMPQVIEIVPDPVNINESLPKGVAFISVDELQKMSTPNFEKVDPKDMIQEASINIVYSNDLSTQYGNVSSASSSNILQAPSVTPDLISSIQPHLTSDNSVIHPSCSQADNDVFSKPVILPQSGRPMGSRNKSGFKKEDHLTESEVEEKYGKLCTNRECHVRLKDDAKLEYHRKCHQNGSLTCLECGRVCLTIDTLHTHLWKQHMIDMELPTCEICGYKTYKKHRLYNIHMKCHQVEKNYKCPICSKAFKNSNQLAKHKIIHNKGLQCSLCQREFSTERRLKLHIAAVHDKIRPFRCSVCEFTSTRKEELKLHLRSHSGEKPYSCEQCSYSTGDHNAIRRHKKLHTKEGAYKCKYCPYTTIQSTVFASHMISKHPNISSSDLHRCPYCPYQSVNKENYVVHLNTTHTDQEGVQLLIEMTKGAKNKPSWTIPDKEQTKSEEKIVDATVNVPIEIDCDSQLEQQDYPKNYSTNKETPQVFNEQVTDLSKDDNHSDCLLSESSSDTMIERQYPQHRLQSIVYDNNQTTLHFLSPTVSMGQNTIVNSPIHNQISNNIMSNFPIRLPSVPQISVRNNIMLKPVDKIPLLMSKVTGPIIKPTQILPVPLSSSSPGINVVELEGAPRKKPKISVKSNLILKGPDEENMFHSQQKMAFKRLEDNERFGLGPVTFNNLITTQFMQLPPEPAMSESPSNIMPYPQETLMETTTPVDNENNPQIFNFNQQINQIPLLPPQQKIQTTDPSYIKIEAITIKQNTQSPSLERMCNANAMLNQVITREYKASPPLEDIHRNMSEIKNEVKSDQFYNIPLNNAEANPPIIDQYLMENIITEQYAGHMDMPGSTVLEEMSDDQQNDVIEIDDNSEDNKLLPRFDMNFPLESLYLMHNDFHFLENDIQSSNEVPQERITEVPIINQKENLNLPPPETQNGDFPNFIQGKKDPMMNTSVRPSTNKINVKNIELMKN